MSRKEIETIRVNGIAYVIRDGAAHKLLETKQDKLTDKQLKRLNTDLAINLTEYVKKSETVQDSDIETLFKGVN